MLNVSLDIKFAFPLRSFLIIELFDALKFFGRKDKDDKEKNTLEYKSKMVGMAYWPTVAFLGVNFAYAIQIGYVTPVLLSLGVSREHVRLHAKNMNFVPRY